MVSVRSLKRWRQPLEVQVTRPRDWHVDSSRKVRHRPCWLPLRNFPSKLETMIWSTSMHRPTCSQPRNLRLRPGNDRTTNNREGQQRTHSASLPPFCVPLAAMKWSGNPCRAGIPSESPHLELRSLSPVSRLLTSVGFLERMFRLVFQSTSRRSRRRQYSGKAITDSADTTSWLCLGQGHSSMMWLRSYWLVDQRSQFLGRLRLHRRHHHHYHHSMTVIECIGVASYGALGHVPPLPSGCLIFQVTSEPHKLWHSTSYGCLSSKTVYTGWAKK